MYQALAACNADEVCSLAGRSDLLSIAERPDVMQRVVVLLECLRGAAQGTSAEAQQPLFGVCRQVMEALLLLQSAYRQHESIVCLLLKLAGDVIEAYVTYLSVSLLILCVSLLFLQVNMSRTAFPQKSCKCCTLL